MNLTKVPSLSLSHIYLGSSVFCVLDSPYQCVLPGLFLFEPSCMSGTSGDFDSKKQAIWKYNFYNENAIKSVSAFIVY